MEDHDIAKEAGLEMAEPGFVITEVPDEVVADDKDPISDILELHKGDPDWSEEELEKAKNDPHAKFDPNGPKSPGEFNRSSPLYTKIKTMKSEHTKEMNRLQKQMDALEKRLSGAEQEGYKKALADIQLKKREAARYGDVEAYDKLEADYNQLQQEVASKPSGVEIQSTVPAGAEEFFERNAHWLRGDEPEDEIMRDEVGAFEQRMLQRREREGKRALSPKELARHLEEYAKTKFPHRFENSAQKKPAAVEAADSPRVKPSVAKVTFDDLNVFQQAACKRFVDQNPGATQAEYIKLLQGATTSVEFK